MRVLVVASVVAVALLPSNSLAQDRSGVRPEVLSVPSGPGSIEGLGEAFDANANTGNSSYSVGIVVPPGVAGSAPSLGLHYASGAPNGEVGLGWTLGLPSIQLGTDRGLPRFDSSDRIVLRGLGTGAEELVQMSDASYRFRIEGAFVRARRTLSGSWEVQTRSGSRLRFGSTASGTIEDSGRVFAWLLTEQLDAHGNSVRYEWTRDATGRPYLDRVVYNDFSASVRNEVSFEWEARPDVLTSYLSTFAITCAKRLRSITVSHGGATVRRYSLSYDSSNGISRLTAVSQSGRTQATALPTLSFEYAQLTPSAMQVVGIPSAPARALGTNTELDDVDGDALPDLLVMDPSLDGGAYSYYPNLDGTSFGARSVMSATPSIWLTSPEVQLADMDGDGAADVVAKVSSAIDGLRYYSSSGASFGAPTIITPNLATGLSDPDIRLIDLDHDRRVDWMRIDPTLGTVSTGLSTGGGAFEVTSGLPPLEPSEVVSFSGGARLVDCNGDGLEDVALFRSGSLRCWPSIGRGRFAAATAIAGAPSMTPAEILETETRDVNGDGLVDLLRVGVSQVSIWLNAGGAKLPSQPLVISGVPSRDLDTVVRVVDVNANGSADILWIDPTNASAPWRYLDVLSQGSPGLLTRIDNGLGKTISIEYAGMGAMRAWARAQNKPWTHRSSVAQTVVSQITTSDGLGNNVVTRHRYADAYFDSSEREPRGFVIAETTAVGDAQQATLVTTQMFDVGDVDPARKGLLLSSDYRTDTGGALRVERTGYEVRSVAVAADGSPLRYASRTSAETDVFELGTVPATTRSAWASDDFGNVTFAAEYGLVAGADLSVGNDESVTRTTYAVDTSVWILDRVATLRIENLDGTKLAESRTYYDGAAETGLPLGQLTTGDVRRVESWLAPDRYATEFFREYDSYGNVIAETDARGSRRETTMDPESHTVFVRETQQMSSSVRLTWTADWDLASGNMRSIVDPNGAVTSFQYDDLERLVAISEDGDSLAAPTRSFQYVLGSPLSHVREETHVEDGSSIVSVVHYDGLARTRGVLTRGNGGKWIARDVVTFGARGLESRRFNPLEVGSADLPSFTGTEPFTQTTHDALARAIGTTEPDGSRTAIAFEPLARIEFDEADLEPTGPHANTPSRYEHDGRGRIVRNVEIDGGREVAVTAAYDSLGNLIRITDSEGHDRLASFDSRSRRTRIVDPNAGTWSYEYDDADQLTARVDPLGNRVSYRYDLGGRTTEEWVQAAGEGARKVVSRHYDVASRAHPELGNTEGMLAWVEDEVGSEYFGYDRRGRHTDTVRRWSDDTETRTWSDYDNADREVRRGFPDGTHLTMGFDTRGLLSRVGPVISSVQYTATGAEAGMVLGNGVVESVEFDRLLRPTRISSTRGNVQLRALRFDYDISSLISSVTDERVGVAGTARDLSTSYEYDDRRRLARAVTPRSDTAYVWNDIGNLLMVTSSGTEPLPSLVFEYDLQAPNRVTRVGSESFTFDAAGRVTADGDQTLTWDDRGRLVRVERGEVVEEYAYDFEDQRVEKRTTRQGNTSVIRYVDRDVEIHDGQIVRYVLAHGHRVARLDALPDATSMADNGASDPVWAAASTVASTRAPLVALALLALSALLLTSGTLSARRRASKLAIYFALTCAACGPHVAHENPRNRSRDIATLPATTEFFHGDLARTPVASSDAAGSVRTEGAFNPFGAERMHTGPSHRRGFLGAEVDAGSGLVDLHVRPYRADLGMFLAPDPASVFEPTRGLRTPLLLSPYFYGCGDPINLSDSGGDLVDTLIDIAAIGFDIYQISAHGATAENVVALAADIAGALVPFVTGGGVAVRAGVAGARAADRANDARHAAEAADAANDLRRANDARRAAASRRRASHPEPPPHPPPGQSGCHGTSCGRPGGTCFVAGTPVRTAGDRETTPIESLSIGDRVRTVGDSVCRDADVVRDGWMVVSFSMPNPDGSGDLIEIRLARSPEWLEQNQIAIGALLWASFPDVGQEGLARVASVEPMPPVDRTAGCVVTGTLTHLNGYVLDLQLEDGSSFRSTDLHPYFSATRNEWHHLRDLHVGERLRLEGGGDVGIASIRPVDGVHRVYNLEIELQHSYLVGETGVWAHNPSVRCPSPGGRGGGPEHRETVRRRADELEAQDHEITHGGGRRAEETVRTPDGRVRHPDITSRAPDGSIHREQVGRANTDGTPVARERRAMDDIEAATGTRPAFTEYARRESTRSPTSMTR